MAEWFAKTLKPFSTPKAETATMDHEDAVAQKIHEEFMDFRKTMEELHALKRVAADLKSYRRMIRLKRYD
jgi:hypothetical protein